MAHTFKDAWGRARDDRERARKAEEVYRLKLQDRRLREGRRLRFAPADGRRWPGER